MLRGVMCLSIYNMFSSPIHGLETAKGEAKENCMRSGRKVRIFFYEESDCNLTACGNKSTAEGLYVILGGLALIAGIILIGFDLVVSTRVDGRPVHAVQAEQPNQVIGPGRILSLHRSPQRTHVCPPPQDPLSSTPRQRPPLERRHNNTPESSWSPCLSPREYWL